MYVIENEVLTFTRILDGAKMVYSMFESSQNFWDGSGHSQIQALVH